MIDKFPADYELIGLFEGEPTVLDPGAPWLYNTLDFCTTRKGIEVQTRMVLSYGKLTVRLTLGDDELALFELRDAKSFRVIEEKAREALVVSFAPERKLDDFILQLKPHIRVMWGNLQFP